MINRTLHDNASSESSRRTEHGQSGPSIDTPALLSTMWIAVLIADLFRSVHETLRPGFIEELARDGTVYGNTVSDATLLGSGLVLAFLVALVVLARVLPRRWNRRVNLFGAALMASGVLAGWPKDPDDYVFGALMLVGVAVIATICVRWRFDASSSADTEA